MGTLGERLRQVREGMGLNQEDFGRLGGVAKHTQMRYEADQRLPDSAYLARLHESGVDVLYVLAGKRQTTGSSTPSSPVQIMLLQEVLEGVEVALRRNRHIKLKPEKKAQLIALLYEHFAEKGRAEPGSVERFLRLVA